MPRGCSRHSDFSSVPSDVGMALFGATSTFGLDERLGANCIKTSGFAFIITPPQHAAKSVRATSVDSVGCGGDMLLYTSSDGHEFGKAVGALGTLFGNCGARLVIGGLGPSGGGVSRVGCLGIMDDNCNSFAGPSDSIAGLVLGGDVTFDHLNCLRDGFAIKLYGLIEAARPAK